MHGSDRVPGLNIDYERASVGMAISSRAKWRFFYECMLKCARKLLDTADIVREASRVENRRSDCSLPVVSRLGFRPATSVRVGFVRFPVPAHRNRLAGVPHAALA